MDSATQLVVLANEVLQQLDQLEQIGCGDEDHRLLTGRWVRETRRRVHNHLREDNKPAEPPATALLIRSGQHEQRYNFRYHELRQDQIPLLWLDILLQGGDTLQVRGIGPERVQAMLWVRGQLLRLTLNVHCGKCGALNCHLIEVPHAWPNTTHNITGIEPYLLRRCTCGDTWRQYPRLVDDTGREVVVGPKLSGG